MNILGLNAYHGDSAACLISGGRLIAAAEEERFRRVKHWAGFPKQAIAYCLSEAKLELGDIDCVAVNQDSRAHLLRKIAYTLLHRPDPRFILGRIRNKARRASIGEELAREFPGKPIKAQVRQVEHHLAHLASAHLVSPFARSVMVSVDGFGDFASAAWGVGTGATLRLDQRVYFPHSLGIFYQALTQYLGFPHYGDEYKVMGLAPYGSPTAMDTVGRLVKLGDDGSFELDLKYFRHHREQVEYEWESSEPKVGRLYADALTDLLGPARAPGEELTQRHKDLARSVQATYENAFFHLLQVLHRRYGLDDLALAGGCAMNSVANGKVLRQTPFKRIYVQSAAGDAGGAIGAACVVAAERGECHDRFHMEHAYWGPSYSDAEVQSLLEEHRTVIAQEGCIVQRVEREEQLLGQTVDAIAGGQVVGWFQGRMEWGPRALGNRSIVCDPRRSDMKEILNSKIKRRESFRPFAPSILREAVPDWFETDDDVPFMMQVYQIRQERRISVPAVTHVDGSGRLQTVSRSTNPRYWSLIDAFRQKTGIPMVLNTSFNENEPVVCSPIEALQCFLRTKMDLLVLGEWIVRRAAHG